MSRTTKPQSARSPAPPADAPAEAPAAGESLDKVREILFGSQAREHERRFAKIEQRLEEEVQAMRAEARKRLDSLEAYLKGEVEALVERVRSEQSDRAAAMKSLAEELGDLGQAVGTRISDLDERATAATREVRQQLLDQSKTLRDEVTQTQETLAQARTRAVEELRGQKVDRAALADLFTEVAQRLIDGVGPPASG